MPVNEHVGKSLCFRKIRILRYCPCHAGYVTPACPAILHCLSSNARTEFVAKEHIMIVQMHSAGSLKLALCRIKVACCMAMASSCVCAHIASGVQLMHVLSEHGSVNYDDSLSIVVSNM